MDPKSDTEQAKLLRTLFAPHVESFDYFVDEGLASAARKLRPLDLDPVEGEHGRFRLWLSDIFIARPRFANRKDARVFPAECREAGLSYTGTISATCSYRIDDGPVVEESISLGEMPIMVRSSRCHLAGLDRRALLDRHEEAAEQGGYFIINGAERVVRLLIVPRRNHAFGLVRPSFGNRGRAYTKYATQMRCVRDDQTGNTMTLHYLSTGECRLRVLIKKQEFFLPATSILFALRKTTSREVYNAIVRGDSKNHWVSSRAEAMLRMHSFKTQDDVLTDLGGSFRSVLDGTRESMADAEVAAELIDEHIFVHATGATREERNNNKFRTLVHMIRKLYALASGRIKPENADALSSHEVLLPGHLYLMITKEKIRDYLLGIGATIARERRRRRLQSLEDPAYVRKLLNMQSNVGDKLHLFMATGNLVSGTGLGLMQTSGFTIVADKLNYFRYLSHFRSVHRGQFFTEMKTTSVRKLLPESWGFMCPVHTPDGSPCGLLNHLAAPCQIVTHPETYSREALLKVLRSLGVVGLARGAALDHTYACVCLDGMVVGYLDPLRFARAAGRLRWLKTRSDPRVPARLEIVAIPPDARGANFPGLFLATSPARLTRPVYNLRVRSEGSAAEGDQPCVEWVSPMEQCFLEIACTKDDFAEGRTTHQELHPAKMLSLIASLTPFSDFNQSPRNMYQCQMGKQSMGHPYHAVPYRSDNTTYRIQTPQAAIVRNENLSRYGVDEYPIGCNAVVAVISYTGYDMEDAMIINKSAFERGFGHGSVYKYKTVDLADYRVSGEPVHHRFGNFVPGKRKRRRCIPSLGDDGLPSVGQRLKPGDPLACVIDDVRNRPITVALKGVTEPCIVQEVRLLASSGSRGELQKVGIKLLLNRNPVIGDKFSSRHGQKGVMSRLYPAADMPFSESGMQPDIIINPHAFPSRMTIGMLIESMAGKAGAMHGVSQDATPFQFDEGRRAVDHFGRQLEAAGYNYCGNEALYSGFTGEPFEAEIFMGVVYYQRLRHMVSDKSQVRATGPINNITRQPIKGRKVHGGIRFGEMERDSLLAHGASFLLHDRLVECSDYHRARVCQECGSLIGVTTDSKGGMVCRNCGSQRCPEVVMPYVFTYLTHELAAMNIKLDLSVK